MSLRSLRKSLPNPRSFHTDTQQTDRNGMKMRGMGGEGKPAEMAKELEGNRQFQANPT
jgi:hypothetical protein